MASTPPTAQDLLRGRKSSRRRSNPNPPSLPRRSTSLDLPDRLKDGEDAADDVTGTAATDMNKSLLFSFLTAARKNADLHTRFDEDESTDDEEKDEEEPEVKSKHLPIGKRLSSSVTSASSSDAVVSTLRPKRLLHPRLRTIAERTVPLREDTMVTSQILPPLEGEVEEEEEPAAPYLSMVLKGEAHMEAATDKGEVDVVEQLVEPTRMGLAERLKDIFGLEEPEEVISEYPCWFLHPTVYLSGHLYITKKHVCFYAYLPKNSQIVVKSGHLGKRGQRNPRYRRYFVELKGDVLRYYDEPSNIYTPNGQIDLRFGISATIEPESKKKRKDDSCVIKLVTKNKHYFFRADNPQAAREWVKHLQRVIFRSHNDGNSVKICLPVHNIIDVEATEFLETSDTAKIHVIDNNETYAIDDYYFSFFELGPEAIPLLQAMVESGTVRQSLESKDDATLKGLEKPPAEQAERSRVPRSDIVRQTLVPMSSDLSSRRSSFESHRSPSGSPRRTTRNDTPRSPLREQSVDSPTTDSFGPGTESSPAIQSIDDTNVSASQILNRSDVFHAPTSHVMRRSRSDDESPARHRVSTDTARAGAVKLDRTPVASPTEIGIQSLLKAGAYPFSRASNLAEMIREHSKRVGQKLATESMGYLEKVSGMWQAPVKHYGPIEGMPPDEDNPSGITDPENEYHSQRFREHFALPESEQLVATYFAHFYRLLPVYGKIYISKNHFCFRSMLPGSRTKLVIPLRDVESVNKATGYRPVAKSYGMVVTVRGWEEIFFDFHRADARDDCNVMLILVTDAARKEIISASPEAEGAILEYNALKEARMVDLPDRDMYIVRKIGQRADSLPILFDDPKASVLDFKPQEPLRITCLTIGSRGDVQPYIALAKGLLAEGHKVRIATHVEFEPWIRKHGIEFAPVSGDPGELMRICIEYGMFTFQFLKEASSKFRGWLDDLFTTAWIACQDTDLLIESPSTMAGIHIAEKLQIPYFRAFTMPWTRTRAYPHAFAVPEKKRGGQYNALTYLMIDNVFWKGIAANVNRWRKRELELPATSLDKMQPYKVPFLYNFSPSVVPPPMDWSEWIRVTGYWFLDEGEDYSPPKELEEFMQRARDDGKKLVYIGFGSILVDDPAAMTKTVIDAVLKADVRCVLAKGWSERVTKIIAPTAKMDSTERAEVPLPPEIFPISAIPHDWLFARVDAVAHHGGSGTTGASLRAGVPTVVKPFFGDQFFFGRRIQDLGVGVCLKKLNSTVFGRALWEATHSERMIREARTLGEKIRAEDGVANAINCIYRDLEYARSLIKRGSDQQGEVVEGIDEHWTLIEPESGVSLVA